MVFLAIAEFTALICVLAAAIVVAVVAALIAPIAWATLKQVRTVRGTLEPEPDWWAGFEQQLAAYSSEAWTHARETERRPDPPAR